MDGDHDAVGVAPHWIDPEQCRLVVDVPYRPNTMLVMLNSGGAHGANIPGDAEPADLCRYIYQFRIGPSTPTIRWLTGLLSEQASVVGRQGAHRIGRHAVYTRVSHGHQR